MQSLQSEMTNLRAELNKAITILKERGQAKAIAERDYRVAVAKEILVLRDKGIAVTIIDNLVKGKEEIADLKLERDIAETLYNTAFQYIYSTKLNIDIVLRQLEAERKGV